MNDKLSAKAFAKLYRIIRKHEIKPVTDKDGKKYYAAWINPVWPRGSFSRSMSQPTTELEAAKNKLFGGLLARGKIGEYSGARMFTT